MVLLCLRRHEVWSLHQHSNFQQVQGTSVPRVVPLDLPRSDETNDPITWIDHAERIFEFDETPTI